MNLKQRYVGLLGVVVSALAIYMILSQVDLTLVGQALAQANYWLLLPAVGLLALGMWTRAVRWRVLLDRALPLRRAFSINNVAYLVNGLLPLRLGEAARIWLATRFVPPVPVMKSAGSIIVERMIDLLTVLVILELALISSPTLPDEYRTAASFLLPLLVIAFIVLLIVARQRVFAQHCVAAIVKLIPVLRRFDLAGWLDEFLDGLLPLTTLRSLTDILLWNTISWGLSVSSCYVIMQAFYDTPSWPGALLTIAAASFVIAVPAVPGSFGTYQWAIMLAMSAMGYGNATDAVNVSFAVVVHFVNLGLYALLGGVGLLQEGITLTQLRAQVENFKSGLDIYANNQH